MKAYTIAFYGKEMTIDTFNKEYGMFKKAYPNRDLKDFLIDIALEDDNPDYLESSPNDIYFDNKNDACNRVNWSGQAWTFNSKGVTFVHVCMPALGLEEIDEDRNWVEFIDYEVPEELTFKDEDLEEISLYIR